VSVVALVMLAIAAVASAVVWWQVDPRRHAISTTAALAALAVPSILLGAAAVFAIVDTRTTDLERNLAVVFGTLGAVSGGGVIATCVLRLADRFAGDGVRAHAGPVPPPPPPPPASTPPPPMPLPVPIPVPMPTSGSAPVGDIPADGTTVSDPDTLRGGAWIGALERLAIVATLLTRWPEGLAVILAVKGLGRYPELRRPAAAERFIIGTIASALWAVACVGVVAALW
jgi:hypothetical protein